jgi:hypothetical protein
MKMVEGWWASVFGLTRELAPDQAAASTDAGGGYTMSERQFITLCLSLNSMLDPTADQDAARVAAEVDWKNDSKNNKVCHQPWY